MEPEWGGGNHPLFCQIAHSVSHCTKCKRQVDSLYQLRRSPVPGAEQHAVVSQSYTGLIDRRPAPNPDWTITHGPDVRGGHSLRLRTVEPLPVNVTESTSWRLNKLRDDDFVRTVSTGKTSATTGACYWPDFRQFGRPLFRTPSFLGDESRQHETVKRNIPVYSIFHQCLGRVLQLRRNHNRTNSVKYMWCS